MFNRFLCEESKNGNCKIDCYHMEPHDFCEGFCNDDGECPEKDKKVKCVEIDMENFV
jgi:hypothetical protein